MPKLTYGKKAEDKPGVLEHWLQRVALDLGGTHHLIDIYWSMMAGVMEETYQVYLQMGPLDRPSIRPRLPAEALQSAELRQKYGDQFIEINILNFHSCELRLRALLLELVPPGIRASCLSTRQTSTIDVLFSCMVDAGPGTGADKDHTLGEVSRGRAVPVGEVYDELQKWKFACTRLATLAVHEPDP